MADLAIRLRTPEEASHTAMVEAYKRDLGRHDWHYAMSDDPFAWRRGQNARISLIAQAKLYDPDFAIWNLYAPEGHQK